jgi:regulator of sirC expression with transglutaminase-like and TPR domain
VADLLLTVEPTAVSELRDRGLLAYHLQDFGAALRDLENYLQLLPRQADEPEPSTMTGEIGDEAPEEEVEDESTQIWEHIKNLRKRVAGFN